MTEQEWLVSEAPQRMLSGLNDAAGPWGIRTFRPSERKLRLFAVACCRMVWHLLTDERSRRAVEVAERYADGLATEEELLEAFNFSHQAANDANAGYFTPGWIGFYASDNRPNHFLESLNNLLFVCTSIQIGQSKKQLACILRCIVGNPYRPVTLTCKHEFKAIHKYSNCDGIGCDGELVEKVATRRLPHPLLVHLRNSGPHWRGCWVLDMLTGKE